jgi:hypothetical protein
MSFQYTKDRPRLAYSSSMAYPRCLCRGAETSETIVGRSRRCYICYRMFYTLHWYVLELCRLPHILGSRFLFMSIYFAMKGISQRYLRV